MVALDYDSRFMGIKQMRKVWISTGMDEAIQEIKLKNATFCMLNSCAPDWMK